MFKQVVDKFRFFLLFLLFCTFFLSAKSQINEYEVKISLLLKFAKYTEWPNYDENFFTIAVFGKNPFEDSLNKVVKTKTLKDKKVKVQFLNQIDEIDYPNILFITKTEKKNLKNVLNATKNKPILVVTEIYNAASVGAHINFFVNNDNKIRFEINTKNLKKSNLKVSSLLLDIAKIVE